MLNNPILNVDSYKVSHYLQYPPGTRYVSSYIESRGGEADASVFFGLQMFLKQYLTRTVSSEDIAQAADFFATHGVPFNREGWDHIVRDHQGRLPIEVQALPEGTVLPVRNAIVQLVNTDPACAWLTSYLETAMLRAVWYPTTVATISWACRQVISRYLETTADDLSELPFKLNDFGARGVSSEESSGIGGAAHLVSFQGTDNLSGVLTARQYYGEAMAGFSLPAAEHSTITCWGRDNEVNAYANMLDQFAKPGSLVAVVSDSYDLWNAIDNLWGGELKEQVERSGARVIIRPDSGDPVAVVNEAIHRLMAKFGSRVNSKGYKVLPDYVRVIQGDGVNVDSIEAILAAMKKNGLSADNIAFGMGGELLQKMNRDTLQFAMKASAAEVNGEWRDVFKDPITDHGKRSKKGRLAVVLDSDGAYETIRETDLGGRSNLLEPVFRDGRLLKEWTFQEVRDRAGNSSGDSL